MTKKYNIYDVPNDLNPTSETEISEMIKHLLGLSVHEIDFDAAKKLCESYYKSEVFLIKRISIMCAGHIARVYRKLIDLEIIKEINEISKNPSSEFYGVANDALDDIETFLDQNIRSHLN